VEAKGGERVLKIIKGGGHHGKEKIKETVI
jgi:hypothetical protein